ncbi:DNA methyltransferase [Kaistella sp.]|uniref:DNA methyltransferase n=1 Tax=Kaistella sp. TaxID=2782235 RepID=UPI002F9390EE
MTENLFPSKKTENKPVTVLGKTFSSEDERRTYFREELRKKLPELKQMEGFPLGEDEDIINLSDPPFYTACPNPWLNDFIAEWEDEKKELEKQGLRTADLEVTEPYAADVSGGKNSPIYNAHSYHTKVPPNAILKYILFYTQPGDIVFDGFAGTGMTAVAARMCRNPNVTLKNEIETEWKSLFATTVNWGERKAIMNDLSPIASNISFNLNSSFDINEFTNAAVNIFEEVKSEFGWLYESYNSSGSKGEIIYCVWSTVYLCPNCHSEISFWEASMNSDKTRQSENLTCPNCSVVTKKRNCDPSIETFFDEVIQETRERVKEVPVFVSCIEGGKRIERELTDKEKNNIEKLERLIIKSYFPKELILGKGSFWGDTFRTGYHRGINRYYDLYTKRNLIVISAFYDKILKSQFEERIKKALLFWFTASQSRLDKTNRYSFNHSRHVGPLANTLYISATPVEISPFYFFNSKLKHMSSLDLPQGRSIVQIGDTTSLTNIEDNTIDYLFIDPPYGDNIPYAELNSLLESWLKVYTRIEKEAIISSKNNKGIVEYQNLLILAYSEYYRILKHGKWMTVIFSNTEATVWNVIQHAISRAGFVVSSVSMMDTSRPGLHGIIGSIAVKQPLVLSCYKPTEKFEQTFNQNKTIEVGVWDFVNEHLEHLPIHLISGDATTAIVERSPKILFDRLISFYVQRSLPVPIDAGKFQLGLRERFIERDGMFFTHEQAAEYERKKAEVPNFIQLSIFVGNEQDAIYWLRNLLDKAPKTEQDLHPLWMKEVAANMRKGDNLPEMRTILEENFLKDELGKWYVPDAENEADLEKLRNRRLMKIFEEYRSEAAKPKGKLKEVRVEALRAGFKQCYQDKDFTSIVNVGDRIPNNLLMEDEVLLQFYDIATSRI